jgi:hypothetical protein
MSESEKTLKEKKDVKRDEKGRQIIAENVPIILTGTIEGENDE